MALACWNATLPAPWKRVVGNTDQYADQANGARAALPLPRSLVALHGFIKKTRATPEEDLAVARKRKTELER